MATSDYPETYLKKLFMFWWADMLSPETENYYWCNKGIWRSQRKNHKLFCSNELDTLDGDEHKENYSEKLFKPMGMW